MRVSFFQLQKTQHASSFALPHPTSERMNRCRPPNGSLVCPSAGSTPLKRIHPGKDEEYSRSAFVSGTKNLSSESELLCIREWVSEPLALSSLSVFEYIRLARGTRYCTVCILYRYRSFGGGIDLPPLLRTFVYYCILILIPYTVSDTQDITHPRSSFLPGSTTEREGVKQTPSMTSMERTIHIGNSFPKPRLP